MKKKLIHKLERGIEKAFCWIVITLMFIWCPLFMIGHYFLIGY